MDVKPRCGSCRSRDDGGCCNDPKSAFYRYDVAFLHCDCFRYERRDEERPEEVKEEAAHA